MPATPNLTSAITNGCEVSKAILVAVEADAHKKAKTTPAIIHLYSFLMLARFNFLKIIERLARMSSLHSSNLFARKNRATIQYEV